MKKDWIPIEAGGASESVAEVQRQGVPKKEQHMTRDCSTLPLNTRFLQIGLEIVPVYGSDAYGWSLEVEEPSGRISAGLRYESLDELFFVLVNMNVSAEGSA